MGAKILAESLQSKCLRNFDLSLSKNQIRDIETIKRLFPKVKIANQCSFGSKFVSSFSQPPEGNLFQNGIELVQNDIEMIDAPAENILNPRINTSSSLEENYQVTETPEFPPTNPTYSKSSEVAKDAFGNIPFRSEIETSETNPKCSCRIS